MERKRREGILYKEDITNKENIKIPEEIGHGSTNNKNLL